MLIEERQQNMKPFIRELGQIAERLRSYRLSDIEIYRIRETLERHKREVQREYSPDMVGDWLKKDSP